jgi:hypothetical protein
MQAVPHKVHHEERHGLVQILGDAKVGDTRPRWNETLARQRLVEMLTMQ